ncbi:MAG: hypothetical protein Q7K42_05670, partial [Candidatus Diapherotrites archaeon]|nr:hypothetical protein [Candidatus Diapherotrites archaeon]
KSSKSFQSNVLGVVSDNYSDFSSTGYNIDEKDNPMPVALSGRVPVKVSTENGVIQAGDLLTTSSTAGVAMKWSLNDLSKAKSWTEFLAMSNENNERQQAVLGKALAPFNSKGIGEILVYVE